MTSATLLLLLLLLLQHCHETHDWPDYEYCMCSSCHRQWLFSVPFHHPATGGCSEQYATVALKEEENAAFKSTDTVCHTNLNFLCYWKSI